MTKNNISSLCNVILRSEATKNLVVGKERNMNSENEILRFAQDDINGGENLNIPPGEFLPDQAMGLMMT